MIVDIVVLVILGISCCIGLGFIMFIQFRTVRTVELSNTSEGFSLLSPIYHVVIGFLGFSVTLATLIILTALDVAGAWVKVVFGIIAFSFGIMAYISTRFRVDFNANEVVKHGIFRSKTLSLSDLVGKRTVSMGFCTIVYSNKGRFFSYNQDCIGSEYVDKLINSLPQVDIV